MKVIRPYLLSPFTSREIPVGAQVLCVRVIDRDPYLLVLVDPNAPTEVRHFRCCIIGELLDEPGRYIGTFFHNNGFDTPDYYVFEITAKEPVNDIPS